MRLANKGVLITGAKRLGASLALQLAECGADVAVGYCQSKVEAEQVVEQIRSRGRRAAAIAADVRQPDQARRLVDTAAEAIGRLDVVVAMASVYGSVPFDELTDEAWNLHLGVDLAGSFYCARAAVPHMRAQGAGHIVLFADTESASGRPLHRGFLSYFVAKSGVIALGRALALELARDRILVNTVALGPTLPADDTPREEIEAVAKGLPTGRWVEPGDVMRTVRHLIESTSMTGEVLRIDGGRHLV